MLIDAAYLRTLFDIATRIGEPRLTPCIQNASRTLKTWVGEEAYDDAGDEDPEDADRADALKSAESYLAMYHVLLIAGIRLRNNGLVGKEQDNAGPIGGNVINQYYTPAELKTFRDEFLVQAETLAAPFLVAAEQTANLGAGTFTMAGGWASSSTE